MKKSIVFLLLSLTLTKAFTQDLDSIKMEFSKLMKEYIDKNNGNTIRDIVRAEDDVWVKKGFWVFRHNEITDKLAESIMGKYGKPTLSDTDGDLKISNYKNPENADLNEFLAHLYECYDKDCRSYFSDEKDGELINIIDEIVALIDQNRYLLSLK